jgi:hypothetical protein
VVLNKKSLLRDHLQRRTCCYYRTTITMIMWWREYRSHPCRTCVLLCCYSKASGKILQPNPITFLKPNSDRNSDKQRNCNYIDVNTNIKLTNCSRDYQYTPAFYINIYGVPATYFACTLHLRALEEYTHLKGTLAHVQYPSYVI